MILGTAILVGSILSAGAMLNYLWKGMRMMKINNKELAVARQLEANIRANPNGFFIAALPETDEGPNVPISLTQDQFAFSDSFFGKAADCSSCPARLSYAIRPMKNVNGSYAVTIVIRYPDPNDKKKSTKTRSYYSVVRR